MSTMHASPTLTQAVLTLECWCVMETNSGLAKDSDCCIKLAGTALASFMLQAQLSCIREDSSSH